MDVSLSNGTLSCHQPFASPMIGFRRWQLLWLPFTYGCNHPFLQRTVLFAVVLAFQCPFSDGFGGWRQRPLLLLLLLLASCSRLPHQHPLPTCLHFQKRWGKLKIDGQDVKRYLIKWQVKKLTMMGRSVQSSSYRHRLWTTQKAWRVSSVTKSFHFLSSKGMT